MNQFLSKINAKNYWNHRLIIYALMIKVDRELLFILLKLINFLKEFIFSIKMYQIYDSYLKDFWKIDVFFL